MSQLVKTKRQANFKGFKRFGAFKGLVEQKNVVFNSLVCKLGLFGTRGPLKRSLKGPIYTQTRQINYYITSVLKSKMVDAPGQLIASFNTVHCMSTFLRNLL
jgi:hypothetical protein